MTQLLKRLAEALVDRPEQVEITEVEADDGTVFELRVAPEDLGKVIGKRGRTARALRTILAASGEKSAKHYDLEIIED